ncbi:LytS/YhcK type 5TM receptor domain-containing protein [Bacillus sp. USDA818B3_A]|uniref:LytS/YhcK type 5TM receptor domain-containing protein n=1 Tax=Bacillus sp. USDA818B3_A TaxID=2698834 RepID=UPI001F27FE89|nr:LytS/YhcK type 5TM receptor domain-containing protein [Bacillus sp. USDA818B3_A]
MVLLDYIINLSIFSLLVCVPLIIGSFLHHKPLKNWQYWAGVYGGIVSIILVRLSFQQAGYSYDIRYAPLILIFVYFGPLSGWITGLMALGMRLLESGHWTPAIIGWIVIMVSFSVIHLAAKQLTHVKKERYLLHNLYSDLYHLSAYYFSSIYR